MQEDFHYYATYCASFLAGFSHEESVKIAKGAQFVDLCTKTLLQSIGAPEAAATTQLQMEMMDAGADPVSLQMITRIWASFHFLPYDLYAAYPYRKRVSRRYLRKYRLICRPNGALVADTVKLAKGKSLQAAGIAMHVLADTWAHQNFAGTPSLVINNTDRYFNELVPNEENPAGEKYARRPITFRHALGKADDLERSLFTNTIYQSDENSVMNLGHGRAGHLPDYSFIRYEYQPAWGGYEMLVKDNPSDYYKAFCQMIYALRYLRGDFPDFVTDTYDEQTPAPFEERIHQILEKRQLSASGDWKAFGESLSGNEVPVFSMDAEKEAYRAAPPDQKDETELGRFIVAALAQKSMVTNRIYTSKNLLAGFSVDYHSKGFKGIREYAALLREYRKEQKK
ncbi:MAG: hypothetical protein J6P72_09210 [Firmicutes bacterium]|nr:hypothetical protein [Bacillota bacterium]